MNNGDQILIERVGNGWIVKPFAPNSPYMMTMCKVFQHMGYASGDEKASGDETLLGFIDKHFTIESKT